MPMLGAGNTSANAKQSALDALTAAAAGGGTTAVSPYHIPITVPTGSYMKPVNQGEFDGDRRTLEPGGVKQKEDLSHSDYFDLSDNGVKGAIGAWYSFSDDHRSELMKKMWYLGLTKSPSDFDGAFAIWQKAVTHAANFAVQGREIDPQHVIDMMADAASEPGKNRQQKTTATSIDLTNPEQAAEWVQQAFQQSMGRKADDSEVRALVDALHQSQQAHPTITTNTPTKWDAQGNAIESSTTKTGGVDPNSFFAARMAADPEASAHQAASTLYPALMQALGAGG